MLEQRYRVKFKHVKLHIIRFKGKVGELIIRMKAYTVPSDGNTDGMMLMQSSMLTIFFRVLKHLHNLTHVGSKIFLFLNTIQRHPRQNFHLI